MQSKRQRLSFVLASVGMLILILDTKTALEGAIEAIEMCMYTVVPTLFPLIVISSIVTGGIGTLSISGLKPLRRLCKIPSGAEPLFILGLIAGYPVGAEAISLAYRQGNLRKEHAERLLGFCSNAGPAFIFGMTSILFSSRAIPWVLWAIQIISAIITGILLPGQQSLNAEYKHNGQPVTIGTALNRGLRVSAIISGWVIMFRIIIAFSNRWFLWSFPASAQSIYCGFLELTNGCFSLKNISSEGMRFILCSYFLSFGGICVFLQTTTVATKLNCRTYIRGKALQSILSLLISTALHYFLFPVESRANIPIVVIVALCIAGFILTGRISCKKGIAFPQEMVYNTKKL